MSQKAILPFNKEISQSCFLLQKSHWALARNELHVAKTEALSACNIINSLLISSPKDQLALVAPLAKYTLSFYKRLVEKGCAALSAQDKFCWLISDKSVSGGYWWPTLDFEELSSANIAPVFTTDENIEAPDFGPEQAVEFRSVDISLMDGMRNLIVSDSDRADCKNPLHDLYQDALSDCSFVSSLLSSSELGLTDELRKLVTIFDNETAKVRIYSNGCWRETGITTKLPVFVSNVDRNLYVKSISNDSLFWPALLEKAYITSFPNQYSFGGSNMANDTYMLTQWLPEIRMVSQVSQDTLMELWDQKQAGNVMIGIGTGTSVGLEHTFDIIKNHDYVLSLYDKTKETCTLTNPWSFHDASESTSTRTLTVNRSLLSYFKFLYLNWKPRHAQTSKIFFVHSASTWPTNFIGDRPQFHLCNNTRKTQEVVILAEICQSTKADFNMSVWQDARNIIYSTEQYSCIAGGKFVNSSHCLIKFELEPNRDYMISITSRHQKTIKFSLTIQHNMKNLTFARAKSSYKNILPLILGQWNHMTAGGNWSNETFINNPQYDFEIQSKTRLMIALASLEEDLDVNFHLLHCGPEERGRKIRNFDQSKLIFNEKYTKRLFVQAADNLEPGHYKLLVSTYKRGSTGDFKLLFAYDGEGPLEVVPTPQALGTFMKNTSFEWNTSNRKKMEILASQNQCRVILHLRSGEDDSQQMNNYRPAIRASVFDTLTKQPIFINGKWNDSIYGLFLDCCLPESGRSYVLLVERFETGEGLCRITVGSTSSVSIEKFVDC